MNSTPLEEGALYTAPDQLPAAVSLFEGVISFVYADTKGIPTIGAGVNIKVADNMALVLNQMVNAQGVNIFAASATNGVTAAQLVSQFEDIIRSHPLVPVTVQSLQGTTSQEIALQNALNDKLAKCFGLTTAQFAAEKLPSFTNFSSTASAVVLGQLLSDTTTIGDSNWSYPSIDGYSKQLKKWLAGGNPWRIVVPSVNLPPENTGEWEGLVSLMYNSKQDEDALIGKGLLTALRSNNAAQAWYQIRYNSSDGGTQNVNRRFLESELFGLSHSGDTWTDAEQAYEMLTEHRSAILGYESKFGTSPNSTSPDIAAKKIAAANNEVLNWNRNNSPNIDAPLYPVQTISQEFDLDAVILSNYLVSQYGSILPGIVIDKSAPIYINNVSMGGGSLTFQSTDIFVAPDVSDISSGFAKAGNDVVSAGADSPLANHILIGPDTVSPTQVVVAGSNAQVVLNASALGNDLLIAGAGVEELHAGAGSDTLIGGLGNDILVGGSGKDVFDADFRHSPDPTNSTVSIVVGERRDINGITAENGDGSVYLNGQKIGASTLSTGLAAGNNADQWFSDDGSLEYTFVSYADLQTIPNNALLRSVINPFKSSLGELVITAPLTTGPAIDIWNFDVSQAEANPNGFLGIKLQPTIQLTSGVFQPLTATSPGTNPTLNEGALQVFTVSGEAPSAVAQTVTLVLSGANASDFAISTGANLVSFSNGTAIVTIPAGQEGATLALVNTADVGGNAALQLTATLNDANGQPLSVVNSSLTFNYVEGASSSAFNPTSTIPGALSGSSTWLYQDDGQNDYIQTADNPNGTTVTEKIVSADAGGHDTIVLTGQELNYVGTGGPGQSIVDNSTGQTLILGGSGSGGNNTIVLNNNNQALVLQGYGNNQIYGATQTDLTSAITQAKTGASTGQRGELLAATDGNNTIVGSAGNDLIMVGSGNNMIVTGPGNGLIMGGVDIRTAGFDWSVLIDNGLVTTDQVDWQPTPYTLPAGKVYEGSYLIDTNNINTPFGMGDDTIFGGKGSDTILLSNGNNYVDAGSGNSTIQGGMGDNVIFGGTGNVFVFGGGGNDYIEGESGNDTLVGRGGDNTIIGGSGNDTISAGSNSSTVVETGNNYVDGGSGNDLIYGDGGHDTLIGGSGTTTLYGGSGTEYIEGGSGTDLIVGGVGNDTLVAGGAGADTLQAYGSDSTTTYIYGGDGSDSINGGHGANVIYSGNGGTTAAPTVVQADWTDANASTTIYGGSGVNELFGNVGHSVIYGGVGTTEIVAGTGDSTVYGGDGSASVYGGSGTDVLYAADGGTDAAPAYVIAGSGTSSLYGGAGSSWLQDATSGHDLLTGGDGNDTILATGNDTIVAGGSDEYLQSNGGTVTFQFNQGFGDDTIISPSGGDQLVFGPGMNIADFAIDPVVFSDGSQGLVLSGDGGSVTFAGGQLPGMIGNITFLDPSTPTLTQLIQQDGIDDTELVSTYVDTLSGYTYSNNLIFNVDYATSLTGGTGFDTISAWGDNDTLASGPYGGAVYAGGDRASVTGSGGFDILGALGHGDTLVAGSGKEMFVVGDANTVIVDYQKTVSDTLQSWVSYTLAGGVQILQLQGVGNLVGTGNSLSDTLTANTGNDTLVAGSGVATLIGGSGNDTFVVNSTADVVQDNSATASNVIQSSVSYVLPTDVNTLILTGSANLTGTANSANDTLVSNAGVDTLVGGAGNDTFVINNSADVVRVSSTTSFNTIVSSVSYVLQTNVQSLVLSGAANLTVTGNSANGMLVGNAGNDSLVAGTGNETLVAGSGNDTLVAGSGSDVLQGGSGADTYVINSTAGNTLIALGSGAQTLRFGSGITQTSIVVNAAMANGVPSLTLYDGRSTVSLTNELNDNNVQLAFADGSSLSLTQLMQQAQLVTTVTGANGRYLVDAGNNHVLNGGSSADTLSGWGSGDTLNAGSGTSALFAHGDNAWVNGGAGADTLAGMGQGDTLIGGTGNTSFIVDNTSDVVQDASTTANNTLQSAVSYLLPTNVNTLTLTGNANLSGTANAGNDTLVSNSGVDTLVGGAGNDLFILNNASDVVVDSSTTSTNTIQSAVSVVLPTNVNSLILTGSANLTGTGNAANNFIDANAGNDTLVSGGGVATLIGGAGNDTFVVNNAADVVQNAYASTNDTLQASVSFVLPTNVNTLVLTGSANLSGTANAGQDTLVSNTGIDTLIGGAGNDLFVVNNASDVVQDAATNVGSTIQSSVSYALSSNIDTLVLTGTANLVATGNADNDTLIANTGNDTLVAGTGNDLLMAQSGNVTLQFNAGFGDDTVAAAGAVNTLSFGSGINSSDFTVAAVVDHDLPSLVLTGDGGSITIDGALTPGVVSSLQFAGGSTLSLAQFLAQAPSAPVTLQVGTGHVIFDASTGDTLSASQAGDTLSGWGAGQTLNAGTFANVTVDAWGNNDTLVAQGGVAAESLAGFGSNDVFSITGGNSNIQAASGSNDTIVAGGSAASYGTMAPYGYAYALPATVSNLVVAANGLNGIGNGQSDVLTAQGSNDTLVAASATDTLAGSGSGTVFELYSSSDVMQIQANGATDSIAASFNYVLPSTINGLHLLGTANLIGTANNNNDVLVSNSGIDTLIGGTGNDLFIVSNAFDVVQPGTLPGSDTVQSSASYVLPANVNELVLTGNGVALIGTANNGNDTLVSNTGMDTLIGGTGNDLFVLNNGNDLVQVGTSGGNDTIQVSSNYVLPANVNTLVLTGTTNLKGTANSGNDTLVSGAGIDTLIGGAGSDTFVINNTNDVIQDSLGGSNNAVLASVNFVLATNFTALTLIGAANLSGTGNGINNTLTANAGNDTLIAGSGLSTMIGGAGDDLFVVNNTADVVQDTTNGGNSTIQSSASYTLPTGITTLALTGSANISGTANNINDTLISNSGVDTLVGGAGNDTFVINNASDVIVLGGGIGNTVETSSSYTLPSAVSTLILTGTGNLKATANNGSDTLISNSGIDTLVAGTGNDLFVLNNSADVVQVGSQHGNDTIETSWSTTLPSAVANLTLVGNSNISGTGNGLSNVLTAGAGYDTLTAGTGAATMVGGGHTLFVINSANDVVTDPTAYANDTVQSSLASYTLPDNISVLQLTGVDQTGIGNSGRSTIIPDNYPDTLIAGSGPTELDGGPADELFIINSTQDYIYEPWEGSISTVQSSISYTLRNQLDVLALTGSTNLTGTDSNTSNYNGNNDTLVSNSGIDTLVGGVVGDVFVVNNTNDLITTNWNLPTNSVQASVNFTLPTNINSLTLTGSAALLGVANSANDTLVSNTGVDTLIGGAGADLFVVNNASDVVQDTINGVNSTIQASINYVLPTGINTLVLVDSWVSPALVGTANSANDTLVSSTGADTLMGGTGNDTFVVNNAAVVVKDSSATANNVIQSSVSYVLPTDVNTLILTGSSALSATGNSANDTLVANGGNDTLIAGSGVATLIGGTGNDLFVINNTADVVQDSVIGTNSSIQSSVSTTLAANVNTLILTGTAALRGTANNGNATLVSNTGVDTLVGGTGNDVFIVNNSSDVIQTGSVAANNTIQAGFSYVLPSTVNTLVLTGTGRLKGTANSGNDTLVSGTGVNTLIGGAGSDVFVINNSKDVIQTGSIAANNTIQTAISYALPTTVNTLVLTGTANLSGTANGNNDTLVSNAGVDTLTGGTGNDTFIVSNAADVVNDSSATATNVIQSSVSYVLPTDVNTLILNGSAALTGTGNSASDVLVANGGNDTLTAGSGVATLIGGAGNDLFVLNNAADLVQDSVAGTNSTIQSSANAALIANINTLQLTGTANLLGTANSANDTLISNTGVDTLVGGAGNDLFVLNNAADLVQNSVAGTNSTIQSSVNAALVANINTLQLTGAANLLGTANSANDTLIANTGVDTLVGGAGNDLFVLNNAADVVQDSVAGTNSTVQSSVNAALVANVNTLQLTGSANVLGTANSANDTLVSNTGVDTLVGGAGNDLFVINNSSDVVQNGAGTASSVIQSSVSYVLPTNVNTLTLTGSADLSATGNSGNDLLVANSGNDTLVSGSGLDTLAGGTGNDVFVLNSPGDVVQLGANPGIDTIEASVSDTLLAAVNTLVLTGYANLIGMANNNDDTLVSSYNGIDTLVAGTGNDTFIVNHAGDVIQLGASYGIDSVQSYVNYTLPDGINTLTLTYGNISGTANGGNDLLIADSADTLISGSGVDTLIGNYGFSMFVLNNPADVLQLAPNTGYDSIEASFSDTLPSDVSTLVLTGSANLVGTGNSYDDLIQGNAGQDTLIAGVGNDTLIAGTGATVLVGGSGNDTFVINSTQDVIQLGSTYGTDTVKSSVSYTLPTTINSLLLTGNANLVGTSNSGNDLIVGNAGQDTLVAGSGEDTLEAGTGISTLIGGTGNDVFVVTNSLDVIQANTSAASNVIEARSGYTLPANINTMYMLGGPSGGYGAVATANSGNDVIVDVASQLFTGDTLVGGSGLDILTGAYEYTSVVDTQGQGALSAFSGGSLTGGSYNDFFAASGYYGATVNTGASHNVISVGLSGQVTIQSTSGAQNILSLGKGVDNEGLSFSKSGNDLILSAAQTGHSVTLANWYANTGNQDITTLQVIEQASGAYSAGSTDTLRNKAIYEFDFASLVNQFNQALAANPLLTSWNLSNGMSSAMQSTSSTQAYGGDLAYYEGIYGNVTGTMNVATVQATLQNAAFGTGLQTIDAWSGISGGLTAAPRAPLMNATVATPDTATTSASTTTDANVSPVTATSGSGVSGQIRHVVPAGAVPTFVPVPIATVAPGSQAQIGAPPSAFSNSPTVGGMSGATNPAHPSDASTGYRTHVPLGELERFLDDEMNRSLMEPKMFRPGEADSSYNFVSHGNLMFARMEQQLSSTLHSFAGEDGLGDMGTGLEAVGLSGGGAAYHPRASLRDYRMQHGASRE